MEFPFDGQPFPDDRWEARGGSPIAAAVIALLGIGAIYFFTQIVFTIVGVVVAVFNVDKLMALRDTIANGGEGFDEIVPPLRWAVMLSQYVALLLPTALLIRLWHTPRVAEYVRFRRTSFMEVALAVVGTVLIIPIGVFVTNALRGGPETQSDIEKMTEKLFTAHSNGEFLFLVFVVAVTPAICEEFFFRGYIQRTFERKIGARSVPLVGVIFGLFHLQPAGLLTLTMIGIWLGFVYNRSRSMLPNMAAHFTNNFIALWLAYAAPVLFGVDLQNDGEFPILWSLVAMPLFAAVVLLYLRSTSHDPTEVLPA
jgi:membrane protease YdiL (CAAX protease family)